MSDADNSRRLARGAARRERAAARYAHIREHYATTTAPELAARLGMSVGRVRAMVVEMGLSKVPRRESDQIEAGDDILRDQYPSHPDLDVLAAELGMSRGNLVVRARRLGLRRRPSLTRALQEQSRYRNEDDEQLRERVAEHGDAYGRWYLVVSRPAHELRGCVSARIFVQG